MLFLLLLSALPAQATIYVFAHSEGSMGAAVITSGPVTSETRIMNARKGVGILGWGGRVAEPPRAVDEVVFEEMAQGAPVEAVARRILDSAGDGYYRVGFVSAQGLGYALPASGCPQPECGVRVHGDFLLIGGGLETGVLAAAEARIASLPRSLSLKCRLERSLELIAEVGGETKQFTSAQLVVDDPAAPGLEQVLVRDPGGREDRLLMDLRTKTGCTAD